MAGAFDDEFADGGGSDADDDDDIARFERMCAERARAEGLLEHEAVAAHVPSDDEEEGGGQLRRVRMASGVGDPSSGGDDGGEWRQRCALLQEKLARRETELTQVRNDVEMLKSEGVGGAGDPSDALKSRLIELTKQNRRLKVTNESQKTKIQQLESEVKKPKDKAQKEAEEAAMQNNHQALLGEGYEDWKKKYLTASNQLQETRHAAQELRAQLQRHKKVLVKEMGSDDVIEKALAVADDPAATSWKGRAAQVAQLQRQVRDLKEQLRSGAGGAGADDDGGEPGGGFNCPSPPQQQRSRRPDAVGEKERAALAQAADKRREEFERLQEEAERLRGEHADGKRKREALKSRNNLLETQLRELKGHVQLLLRKSDDDDALVNVLRRQLGRDGEGDGASGGSEELRQENAELKAQLERQAQIVVQLRQKSMAQAVESGSTRLGPKSAEAGISERQLVERVRYLEAENARCNEQVRLMRERTGDDFGMGGGGSSAAGSRPFSSESLQVRKERLRQMDERLGSAASSAEQEPYGGGGGGGGGGYAQQHRYRSEEARVDSSPSCRSSRSSSRGVSRGGSRGSAGLGASGSVLLGVAG